jgi:AcrR family transcriptional regulator
MTDHETKIDGRRERSRRTRAEIARAAGALFVERGYASTTIAAIADAAGVAQPTIYASFGTKAAVMAAALDLAIAGDDEPVVVNDRPWMHAVFNAATAQARLPPYAAAVRRIYTGAGDMFHVVAAASSTDDEAAALAETTEARRRSGATSVVDAIRAVGGLRHGLSRTNAVDLLTLLNSPATFQHLVRRCGWTVEHYERWLARAMVSQLLD